MPILRVPVENADELLNASFLGAGALGRVERSATGGGAGFSEISTFALVSGTRIYIVYDLAGADGSFYRVRYSKSDGSSASSYGAEFQAGDETAGYLCSIYDIEQRAGEALDEELLLDIIKEVSDDFEDYCGAWLAPRPTFSTGTTTLIFDVPELCYELPLLYANRYVGIRSLTAFGVATQDQPATGGSYTSGTVSDALIRPQPYGATPGYRLRLLSPVSGAVSVFYPGYNTLTVTGSFGPAAVEPRIQGVAIEAVIRKYIGKQQTGQLLPSISPGAAETLSRHRFIPVG